MAEHNQNDEDGTTLVELLVVMVLLVFVGGVTTAGIVQGLRTQTAAQSAADTLDESRISLQRMRDVIRGGTAICPGSHGTRLELWTDRADTGTRGVFEDEELSVFEVDTATSQLTREDGGGGATVLISQEIVNTGPVFTYPSGADPADQTDLDCTDGTSVDATAVVTSRVAISLEVEHPTGGPNLTADTAVRLRNAGLRGLAVDPGIGDPTARIDAPGEGSCVVGAECVFDGSNSADDETPADELGYAWYLGDGETIEETNPEFVTTFGSSGEYTVRLVVIDDDSNTDEDDETVLVVDVGENRPPVAAFTFECSGAICDFDATGGGGGGGLEHSSEPDRRVSSDPDDGTDDLTYAWEATSPPLEPQSVENDQDPQFNFAGADRATVLLTVSDGEYSRTSSVTIVTAANRLQELTATGGPKNQNSFDATVTVTITTSSGAASPNQEVTFNVQNASETPISCVTDENGVCSRTVSAHHNNTVTFEVNSVEPTGGGTGEYDEAQNLVEDSVSVTKNSFSQAPQRP